MVPFQQDTDSEIHCLLSEAFRTTFKARGKSSSSDGPSKISGVAALIWFETLRKFAYSSSVKSIVVGVRVSMCPLLCGEGVEMRGFLLPLLEEASVVVLVLLDIFF